MNTTLALMILHLVATAAMCGIIWQVQLVQYPGFHYFDESQFRSAMKHHQNRISVVVIPFMVVELVLALFLAVTQPTLVNISAAVIVLSIWTLTFSLLVPLHDQLLRAGYNRQKVSRLVKRNWSRTILWTVKLFIVFGATIKSL